MDLGIISIMQGGWLDLEFALSGMFPGLEKCLCLPFFKSRVTSKKFTMWFVYFDRDSQTFFAEGGTKLLLNLICLSGSCFGNSKTIISVQAKIAHTYPETPLLSGIMVGMRQKPRSTQNHHNYPC